MICPNIVDLLDNIVWCCIFEPWIRKQWFFNSYNNSRTITCSDRAFMLKCFVHKTKLHSRNSYLIISWIKYCVFYFIMQQMKRRDNFILLWLTNRSTINKKINTWECECENVNCSNKIKSDLLSDTPYSVKYFELFSFLCVRHTETVLNSAKLWVNNSKEKRFIQFLDKSCHNKLLKFEKQSKMNIVNIHTHSLIHLIIIKWKSSQKFVYANLIIFTSIFSRVFRKISSKIHTWDLL